MASEAQQNKGYLLPTPITGWDLICVHLKIPDAPEYRAAFRGQLKGLTDWWNWEKNGDTRPIEAATYWRQIIHEHLVIQDCDELELFGGDEMAQFKMCWFVDTDGSRILRYSLNDGCTWQDVEFCDDSNNVPPTEPVDPIDEPGGLPDPTFGTDVRCRVADVGFFKILGDHDVFNTDLWPFLVNVMLVTPSEASAALLSWLSGRGNAMGLSSSQYYAPFKALYEKYYPYQTEITIIYDDYGYGTIKCIVFDCLPEDGTVTRPILTCIATGIDALVPSGDTNADRLWQFIADFIRAYPLEWARYRALVASSTDDVIDCAACVDEADPEECTDMLIQFESEAEPYNMTVGLLDVGRAGKGIKSSIVPTNLFPNPNGYPLAVGLNVEFFPPEACNIQEVAFRYKNVIGAPEPNANNNLIDVHWNLAIWNGETLVYSKEHNDKGIYYYNLATSWPRLKDHLTTPVVGDKVIISCWQFATSITRILKQWIDDVEIIMVHE